MLSVALATAFAGIGTGNTVVLCSTCVVAGIAVQLGRRHAAQVEANCEADGLIPASTPLVHCSYEGMRLKHDGQRRVCIAKGVLCIGRKPGRVDDLVPLEGAIVEEKGTAVTVAAKRCPLLTLELVTSSEAATWAKQLREAAASGREEKAQATSQARGADASESEPAPGAAAAADDAPAAPVDPARAAQQARIEQLEKRVNATLREAVSRGQRIQELEALATEGREQRQKELQALKATAEQSAKEVAAKAKRVSELREHAKAASQEAEANAERAAALEAELAAQGASKEALQEVVTSVQDMISTSEDSPTGETSPTNLKASAKAVGEAMPETDTAVTELMEGMASALRWPNALRRRLANAEQSVSEHKQLQESSAQQLDDLKKQFEQERIHKEEAEARATDLQKQLAIAQHAANEAAEKLLQLEDARAKETEQLKQSIGIAQSAADENLAKLEDALVVRDQNLQEQIAEVEAQKLVAESTAEDLRGRLAVTRKAAADAEAQLQQMQVTRQEEIKELRRQVAIARESKADRQAQIEDGSAVAALTERFALETKKRLESEARAADLQQQLHDAEAAHAAAAAVMTQEVE